jgi:uncharacterized protein (DUF302 family)
MKTRTFRVQRIAVDSRKYFEELVAALEKKIPAADFAAFNILTESHVAAREIDAKVQSMVGDLGFMILGKIHEGPLVSLLGKPKKLTTYLIGNPVLANRMFEQQPEIGLYAPLRAAIYEDYKGKAHFTYDRPSSLLGQFENSQIQEVGNILDEKMAGLAEYLTQ